MQVNALNSVNFNLKFSDSPKGIIKPKNALPAFLGNSCEAALIQDRKLSCDVFERQNLNSKEIRKSEQETLEPLFYPKQRLGVNKRLLNEEKIYNGSRFDDITFTTKHGAEVSVSAAKAMKKVLDEEYGKDNYVFVSIGTSPSGVGKALEFMGQDVRYVPFSGVFLGIDETDYAKVPQKYDKTGKYLEFLNSIGLSKQAVECDPRHYIVCDYTCSGSSLRTAEALVRNVLDINSDNVHYCSLTDTLDEYGEICIHEAEVRNIEDYIYSYCAYSIIEDMCGIPHLNYHMLDTIEEKLAEGKRSGALDFEIALCHYLNNK